LNPEWFTFLMPAYPGCPGKRPLSGCSSSSWLIVDRLSKFFHQQTSKAVSKHPTTLQMFCCTTLWK